MAAKATKTMANMRQKIMIFGRAPTNVFDMIAKRVLRLKYLSSFQNTSKQAMELTCVIISAYLRHTNSH